MFHGDIGGQPMSEGSSHRRWVLRKLSQLVTENLSSQQRRQNVDDRFDSSRNRPGRGVEDASLEILVISNLCGSHAEKIFGDQRPDP